MKSLALLLAVVWILSSASAETEKVVGRETIKEAGRYFVEGGRIELAHSPGQSDQLELFVQGRDRPVARITLLQVRTDFSADLGLLGPEAELKAVVAGSTEVASFALPLVRRPTFYSSGYPDPREIPLSGASPLSGLTMLQEAQPRIWFWRGEMEAGKGGYRALEQQLIGDAGGFSMKIDDGEIRARAMRNLLPRYAKEHPGKIAMIHYNARYVAIMAEPDMARYSPGHWLYYVGSPTTSDLDAAGRAVGVPETGKFRVNDVVALIPIAPDGGKIWENAEYAVVQSIKNGELTLGERGILRTVARDHRRGTWIAPLVTGEPNATQAGYRGNHTLTWYNFATNCPLDGKGRNCGDVTVEILADLFRPGGPCQFFHGMDFDVLFDTLKDTYRKVYDCHDGDGRMIDTDVDGAGDFGFGPEGENLLRLGIYDFVRKLRCALGPNRIITTDGNGSSWPEFPDLFNGIESESLSWVFDYYSAQWANDLNYWQYWMTHATPKPQYNYLVAKFPWFERTYPTKVADIADLTRLNYGAAAALDIGVTKMASDPTGNGSRLNAGIDQLTGIPEARGAWLGKPLGPLHRPALFAPDLRGESEQSAPMAAVWTSSGATLSDEDGSMRVRANEGRWGSSATDLTIESAEYAIPADDLVVQCDIKAAPLVFYPASVPRYVFCDAVGGMNDPYSHAHFRQQALAGSSGYTHVLFYFRNAGPARVRIQFEIQGPQDFWIKNFKISHASDVLAREFEHGLVLCNPSLRPWTFDLGELCPGESFQTGDSPVGNRFTVAPFSAGFLEKTK